jgi:hypothetical protein
MFFASKRLKQRSKKMTMRAEFNVNKQVVLNAINKNKERWAYWTRVFNNRHGNEGDKMAEQIEHLKAKGDDNKKIHLALADIYSLRKAVECVSIDEEAALYESLRIIKMYYTGKVMDDKSYGK